MSSREASPLQSDATSANSLHADDAAACRDVATGAGVQSLPFNGLQTAPELSPARGRSRLQQMFADVTSSIYRECQEKAPGADWVIAPTSVELPDERIAFVPTDAAWKRHDEQVALRTGLALLTNEEHTQVAAWVSMRTAGRS